MKKFVTMAVAMLAVLSLTGSCSKDDSGVTPPDPDPGKEVPDTPGNEDVKPLTKVPFNKGLNLSDWFNVSDIRYFKADTYTDKDFDNLKSLGIDALRLPLNFPIFMGGAPEYKFSDSFLTALDKAVDMALKRDMYIILDQHSYYGSRMFPEGYGEQLVSAGLRQLAQRYKDRSDHLIIELFNEPGGTYLEANWPEMQKRLIAGIRAIDKNRILIVTGYGCMIDELMKLPEYDDKRLIHTFHFYNPFIFTHQGANWDNNPLQNIGAVDFPYDATTMPAAPESFNGNAEYTGYYNSYPAQGTEKYIGDLLMNLYSWASQNGRLLFCGEFGTLTSAPSESRARWYKTVCDYFAAYGISWTAWEYRDTKTPNFGIFKGANIFESNLDVDLCDAMGLTVPESYRTGCPEVVIFDDEIPFWWQQGGKWEGYEPKIDFMCKENPEGGSLNCIRWDVDDKWGGLVMTPWPVADFSRQHSAGANLEFSIRADREFDSLTVRFTQYKEGAAWQWRNMVEICTSKGGSSDINFAADGQWHRVSIPLSKFYIHGTQGDWKDAPGAGDEGFAWDCINHIEFVPEGNGNLVGKTIYLDNIRIRK